MNEKEINYHKKQCKIIKKYNNPKNLTLMQIQHEYSKNLGFKKWSDLINSNETKNKNTKTKN